MTESQASADEVVQTTGWVFNNETGDTLTLAEFVATGDTEVPVYLDRLDLTREDDEQRTLIEIGCGIGRMTCAFTRRYGVVYACDLDAGFLERCREAVARFGNVDRLRTIEVTDGRSLEVPAGAGDLAFSYITLQHCDRDDALALVAEALRAVGPGRAGRPALPVMVEQRSVRTATRSADARAAPPARDWEMVAASPPADVAWPGRPTGSIPTR